jgi:hypothetical protein
MGATGARAYTGLVLSECSGFGMHGSFAAFSPISLLWRKSRRLKCAVRARATKTSLMLNIEYFLLPITVGTAYHVSSPMFSASRGTDTCLQCSKRDWNRVRGPVPFPKLLCKPPLAPCFSSNLIQCTVLTLSSVSKRVTFPGQSAYDASVGSYFDGKSRLAPNCIVQPESAEEVSAAVKVLTTVSILKPCQFAVRSGGHTPIPGSNNIGDGVTIDLLYMNSTTYNPSNKVASILPAARWGSVYQTLEPLGRMVAGGRGSTVGVGGFLLGGGISHHAPRVGLSCDNVVNFQVILSDGRIVNSNKDTNPDLFTALKGGSSNFGIVTRYDMETFENENLWGGIVSWPASTVNQHFKALVNFGMNPRRDPMAALIVFQGYSTASPTDVVRAAFDYTKPVSRPDAYTEFFAVAKNISDTTKIQPMSAVAAEFGSDTTKR